MAEAKKPTGNCECVSTAVDEDDTARNHDAVDRAAMVFKALGDPVRLGLYLAVIERAGDDDVCVCDIPDMGVSQSTVSHHLRKLREAGLVESRREGTWIHYRATDTGLDAIRDVAIRGVRIFSGVEQ